MFLKIAHRGARAYEPENTLKSFRKAMEMGANAIEFDVRQTKDQHLVIMHDEKVERTTNGFGLVRDMILKEVNHLVAGGHDEKVPTVDMALDFVGRKVAKILIELKEIGFEKKVLDLIQQKELEEFVIITSFLEDALKETRTLNSNIETGLIYVKHKNPIEKARELEANYLLPLYRLTHTENVQRAHKKNLKVLVWTINDLTEMKTFIEKGVDGIATDRPDLFKEIKIESAL